MRKLERLYKDCKAVGLHFNTYSPGDGITRYRFFTEETDYFGGSGIYTALGYKEAVTFAAGYVQGYSHAEGKHDQA